MVHLTKKLRTNDQISVNDKPPKIERSFPVKLQGTSSSQVSQNDKIKRSKLFDSRNSSSDQFPSLMRNITQSTVIGGDETSRSSIESQKYNAMRRGSGIVADAVDTILQEKQMKGKKAAKVKSVNEIDELSDAMFKLFSE